MKSLILLLLFSLLLFRQPCHAQHTRSGDVVINAFPLGFASFANIAGEPGIFGNALAPSASVYWRLNWSFFWNSGVDAYIVYGKDAQGRDASALGVLSLYHGVMLRANRDVTRNGFYLLAGVRAAYVPDVDITRIRDKGSLFLGPMISVGFETGKIGRHLGFSFDILNISPLYCILKGHDARSSSWLTAVAFYRIGVSWAL